MRTRRQAVGIRRSRVQYEIIELRLLNAAVYYAAAAEGVEDQAF